MNKNRQDIAASVHQRLMNRARGGKRSFNELLQLYAMERFLYRLSLSPYCENFVLKGALMFVAWGTSKFRPTLDIDLLGFAENSKDNLEKVIAMICKTEIPFDDGLIFEDKTIRSSRITTDSDYEGVRLTLVI